MANASGLHGPRTLTRSRQVCIPVTLLRQLGLEEGDDVYFEMSPDGAAILVRPATGLHGTGAARR
jgi:bifunctional DNA-binding transcriptional regulator/antitoxin component of YhaV-PrlF toxin-antitoxin module